VEITAGTLERLMTARGAPAGLDAARLLEAAGRPEHKLAVTLLSAWEAGGASLGGLAARELSARRRELSLHRLRLERYAGMWERIRQAAPEAYTVKGLEIAALYPGGLVRQAGDLDVVCPRPADVWRVAGLLGDQGWSVDKLSVLRVRGRTAAIVAFVLDSEDPELLAPYEIEVSTVALTGNVWRPEQPSAPHARDAPTVKNVVAILAERAERAFTTRDLLDLALLLEDLDAGLGAVLDDGLERSGMWPEWHEALAGLAPLGLLPAGFDPAASARRARSTRLRRLLRGAATLANPLTATVYWTQARLVDDAEHPVADRVSKLVGERVGGERLLRSGLPLFGVPLDPDRRAPDLRLELRGRHLVAISPVGSFLLVSGVADASWLEEAAG
jgi:hypothetical protein